MPKKIIFTEDQIQEMIRLRQDEKWGFKKIGKKFNVSSQTVERRLASLLGTDLGKMSLKYSYDEYFFYDIDTAEKAYWLGFITADGYVNEDRKFVQIHLQWKDHLHLEKFRRCVCAEKRIVVKKRMHSITHNYIAELTMNGGIFVKGLTKHGVRQNKSAKEEPPINIPDEFIRDYIRGLFDGDGHIDKKEIDLRGSYKLCKWVQEYLIDKCSVSKTKIQFDSNIYRVYFCKNRINILNYLYYENVNKNIVLDRKYKTVCGILDRKIM